MENTINVLLKDYTNATDGSLLVKKGKVWVATTKENLLKEELALIKKHEGIAYQIEPLIKENTLLIEERKRNDKLLARLVKLVACLVYERNIDKGVIVERKSEQELIDDILKNGNELPQELQDMVDKIMKGLGK